MILDGYGSYTAIRKDVVYGIMIILVPQLNIVFFMDFCIFVLRVPQLWFDNFVWPDSKLKFWLGNLLEIFW
jgi:hypothetical protein